MPCCSEIAVKIPLQHALCLPQEHHHAAWASTLCYFKPALQFTHVLKNCSIHKGRTPSPCWKLWANRSESYLSPYLRWPGISVSRKLIQITLGCSHWHKTALFPLTVSLWFQFREPMHWKPEVGAKLLQPVLSHWWVLGWELYAACAGLDRIPPSAGWHRAAAPLSLPSWFMQAPLQLRQSTANPRPPPGAAHFFQQNSYKPCSKAPVRLAAAVSPLILWAHRGFRSALWAGSLPFHLGCSFPCPEVPSAVQYCPGWGWGGGGAFMEMPRVCVLAVGSGLGALWRYLKRCRLSFQQQSWKVVPQGSALAERNGRDFAWFNEQWELWRSFWMGFWAADCFFLICSITFLPKTCHLSWGFWS